MKKVVLSVVILFLSIHLFSQTKQKPADPKFRFGLSFGPNYSHLYSQEALPTNADIENGIGFKLGVLMEYSLSKYLSISPKLELSYNNSKLVFLAPDNSKFSYTINPVDLDFMTHLIYKTGKGKQNVYFLAGPNLKFPLAKKSSSYKDFNTKTDLAFDFGIGLENKYRYFRFAPELRFSIGCLNISDDTTILSNLKMNTISLVFNFK